MARKPLVAMSYSLENDEAWNRSVNTAMRAMGDLRQPFKLIANDFYKSEMSIFKLKSSGRFPDFKNDKSKNAKMKDVGFDYPLLLRTGNLMSSVTNPWDADAVLDIKRTYMIIGTDVEYGIYHQTGTKNMKERKFLFIGPEAPRSATNETKGRLERWERTLKEYTKKKLKSVGKVK